jgi:hypothetical protein
MAANLGIDHRADEGLKRPIARGDSGRRVSTNLASGTTQTENFEAWGQLLGFYYGIDQTTTDTTFTIAICDSDGIELYANALVPCSIGSATKGYIDVATSKVVPLTKNHQVKITFDTAQTDLDFEMDPVLK